MSDEGIYQIDNHYVLTEDVDDSERHVKSAVTNMTREGLLEPLHGGRHSYVYRKCSQMEFNSVMRDKALKLKTEGRNAEKWLTETLDHSKAFVNKGSTMATDVTMEIGLHRGDYKAIRGEAIPQKGSKALQPTKGKMKNLVHDELLKGHPKGKMNLGLKGSENVKEFNQRIVSIRKVDPHGMTKNAALKWVQRNKVRAAFLALSVVVDAGNLILSVIEDDGKFGPSTQVTLSEIAGGHAGAYIGGLIGSLFPGIGTTVGALLGGIIGSFIAGGITRMFVGCNPTVPGPGPPLLDTDPRHGAYGRANMGLSAGSTGRPGMGLHTGAIGRPGMGLDTGARGFPSDF